MSRVLNPTFLDSVKCSGAAQLVHFDAACPGLSICVAKTGRKSWMFTYTSPRDLKRAKVKLGTYPAIPLADARTLAEAARGHVQMNRDPRDVAASTVRPKTVAELIEDRLVLKVKGHVRTADEIERRYRKYIIPFVGDVPVPEFRIDPHYNKCVDPLVAQGKLRQAGVVHTDLVTLMKFAVSRGVIEYTRLVATETPDPKNVCTRFLTVPEIVTFWQELPAAIVRSKSVQRILKLCLVLGQRVGEVSGMTRTEVDRHKMLWTIPAARVKNGDSYGDHTVPLPELALGVIQEAWDATNSEFLFPNEAGDGPLPAEVIASTLRRALEAGDFTAEKFTPHDLRRTVGTQMLNRANGLAIPKFSKYLVLNHRSATKGNVSDEVYDQNDYLDEKREALDRWGAFLAKLVGEEIEEREAA